MFSKESIETAYCFFHQKERVYRYSTMDWQKDDIEMAISSFVDTMPADLYAHLAQGKEHYLLEHSRFHEDLNDALAQLEKLLFG